MAKETEVAPTWGYKKEGDQIISRIFDLEKGDKLPNGWADTPAKFK